MSKDKLPRFLIADNPLLSDKNERQKTYIVVTGEEWAIIRTDDWQVMEGDATEKLLKRVKDWYHTYLFHTER